MISMDRDMDRKTQPFQLTDDFNCEKTVKIKAKLNWFKDLII